MTGAYGVEGRFPFLDTAVVQETLSLDPALKNTFYKAGVQLFLRRHGYPHGPCVASAAHPFGAGAGCSKLGFSMFTGERNIAAKGRLAAEATRRIASGVGVGGERRTSPTERRELRRAEGNQDGLPSSSGPRGTRLAATSAATSATTARVHVLTCETRPYAPNGTTARDLRARTLRGLGSGFVVRELCANLSLGHTGRVGFPKVGVD